MIKLRRATGPTALLDVAFKQGNMAGAFALLQIRRRLRKGDVSSALERAERYLNKGAKTRLRKEKGRPWEPGEIRIATGQLLYQIGETEAALSHCILPEIESMMESRNFAQARIGLDDVLRAEPDCARALDLRRQIPADYG
jgi:hypothetical protein